MPAPPTAPDPRRAQPFPLSPDSRANLAMDDGVKNTVRGRGQVVGMDVNASIVDAVNARRCTSSEPGLAEGLAKTVDLSATTDMASAVADAELIFILVPTPNSGGRDYYNHRCGPVAPARSFKCFGFAGRNLDGLSILWQYSRKRALQAEHAVPSE